MTVTCNMNGGKPLQNMMMDYCIHKGSFLNFFAPNKNLDYSSYSYFSSTRLGNVRNTAGVNHSCCCAIAEILWSRSRLPEISKFLKIGDGYVIAATPSLTFLSFHSSNIKNDQHFRHLMMINDHTLKH